jgi:hypothetical protein
MKLKIAIEARNESGSALMCALGVLTVLSLIAANLLMNSTTRYNVTAKQVKGWKEALIAAEAGADLAFAEVRKNGLDSTTGFPAASNWASPAPAPFPVFSTTNSWELGYTNAGPAFGANNSLSAKVTVDKFQLLSGSNTIGYYRIRSIGSAELGGFSRAGMDDRMNATTRGDSILRKIDFSVDHFLTTYGFGDALATAAATSGNGKTTTAVSKPRITRRVELIAIPVMPIEGAVKTNGGAFNFPLVDSYDSQYGAYPGTSLPSTAPFNTASNQGNVVDGSSTFSGTVYGSVTTNGGSANSGSVTGVIDNNVPVAPVSNMAYTPGTYETNPGSTLTPPARQVAASPAVPADERQQTTFWYHYASISGLTINPAPALYSTGLPSGGKIETTVNIVCDGDVHGITVNKGVKARIYFKADVTGKANTYDNLNADGVQVLGVTANPVVIPTYTDNGAAASPRYTISSYSASSNVSRADHLWFYGEGTNQSITLDSAAPSTLYAGWYAPNADFSTNGNPDFCGAAVTKSFSGNGNNTFHYDLELATTALPLDYRVASYIEDVR